MKSKLSMKGFSLVELMVVVAIISVLAALAIPRFKTFQAKARQAEAKSNLSHIYTLEESYRGENDTYVDLAAANYCGLTTGNLLGFVIPGGCNPASATSKVRYGYAVGPGSTTTAFTATATSGGGTANKVNPDCAADIWTMDQNKVLRATNDSVKTCIQ